MFETLKHFIADAPDAGAEQRRWVAVRRAPRECDRAISGTTRQWLRHSSTADCLPP